MDIDMKIEKYGKILKGIMDVAKETNSFGDNFILDQLIDIFNKIEPDERTQLLEMSRNVDLPDDIVEKYEEYSKLWTFEIETKCKINSNKKGRAALYDTDLLKAASYLLEYLLDNGINNMKILEVYAGNGHATNIIYKILVEKYPDIIIKSTDLLDYTDIIDEKSYPVEFNINSIDTIEKYKNDNYNTLLMISPPPSLDGNSHYSDYFTIKKWQELESSLYLIIIGELGASDASEGMYKYLLNNNQYWLLDKRKLIHLGKDLYGGNIEKEIFIFKKK